MGLGIVIKYILSYGGGVDSTALAIWLIENKKPLDYIVFSDTGNEVPETYYFIDKYMKPYLQKNNIEFVTVFPYGKRSLWTRCFKRKVIPDMIKRWCTRDVKVTPIHTFYRSLKSKIVQYMGINYDEWQRCKSDKQDWIRNIYPLVDSKITRNDCIEIIKSAGLPVPVKSGCFFCIFNNNQRWAWLKTSHPNLYELAQKLEHNNKRYPNQLLIKSDTNSTCDSGYCMT